MKLYANGTPVERLGIDDGGESGFMIHNSALAFRILSAGLYSDPIKAILRELGTNAYDAHQMAGTPEEPFEIHLPTKFESWFSIKDFGVGMPEEQVRLNYCSYFGSTKTQSNKEAGCFGLGSKSPFAYTETFSITSCHQGEKKVYTAYVAEDGMPRVNLISSDPTEDHDGVEVLFPVKPVDIWNFHSKAQDIYRNFPVWPKSNLSISISRPSYSPEGEADHEAFIPDGQGGFTIENHKVKWGINKLGNGGGIRILQGPVGYPLDTAQIDFAHPILSSSLDVTVTMGDVEMTPSRESLNYTELTKRNLRSIFEAIGKVVAKAYLDKLDACTRRVEALILLCQWRANYSSLYKVIQTAALDYPFKNFKLTSDKFEIDQTKFLDIMVQRLWFRQGRNCLQNYFNSKKEREDIKAGRCTWLDRTKEFVLSQEVVLIYDDTEKSGFRSLAERAKHAGEFNDKTAWFISPSRDAVMQPNGKNKWIRCAGALESATRFAREFEVDLVLASTLLTKYPPVRVKGSNRVSTRTRIWEETTSQSGTESGKWVSDSIQTILEDNEEEIKFFVKIAGFSVDAAFNFEDRPVIEDGVPKKDDQGNPITQSVPRGWIQENRDLRTIIDAAKSLGFIDQGATIFGVNVKDYSKIQDEGLWVSLVDFLIEKLTNLDNPTLHRAMQWWSSGKVESFRILNRIAAKAPGTKFAQKMALHASDWDILDRLESYSFGRARANDLHFKCRELGQLYSWLQVEVPQLDQETLDILSEMSTQYPLAIDLSGHPDHLKGYLDVVDENLYLRERILELESQEMAAV